MKIPALFQKILKFGITGGLGTITNLILFFLFADLMKFPPLVINIFCFLVCSVQNYIINHLWTFKVENGDSKPSVKLWFKFFCGSLLGFAMNFSMLTLLIKNFSWPLYVIPQGIGILCGMVFNFLFSNFIVFRKHTY